MESESGNASAQRMIRSDLGAVIGGAGAIEQDKRRAAAAGREQQQRQGERKVISHVRCRTRFEHLLRQPTHSQRYPPHVGRLEYRSAAIACGRHSRSGSPRTPVAIKADILSRGWR